MANARKLAENPVKIVPGVQKSEDNQDNQDNQISSVFIKEAVGKTYPNFDKNLDTDPNQR